MSEQASFLDDMGTAAAPKNPLERDFWKYHHANPHVYVHFDSFTRQAIKAGFKNLGAHMIIQRIRWETMIETQNEDGLKISNSHFPYYARLWMRNNPEHAGFFRTHALKYSATGELEGEEEEGKPGQSRLTSKGAPDPLLGAHAEAMIATARAEAMQGVAAYRAFWESCGGAVQKIVLPQHGHFKSIAQEADLRRGAQ